MTVPPLIAKGRRAIWAGLAALALAQAGALVAGVTGTRLAFGSLDRGAVSPLALGLIAGAALAMSLLRPGLRLLAERVGQQQTMAIREALLRHAMATPAESHAARRRGYLMLRLTGDMTTLKDGIARSLPQILQAAALIPGALMALWLIDNRFAAVGLAFAVITLACIAMAKAPLRRAHETLRGARAKLAADMAERLPIAPDLAHLGRRKSELSRLAATGRALHRKAAARLIRVEALKALPGGLAGLCAFALLLDGAGRGLAAGEIAAALAATGVMAHALFELATAADRLAGWRIARDSLSRHLASADAPDDPRAAGLVRLVRADGLLSVTCKEGLTLPAQLELRPGEKGVIAAADPEVLVQVLSGQRTHPQISVLLDGIALCDLSPGTLRRSTGILTAAPVLLKGSVRRNLCLGLSDRPDDTRLVRRVNRAGLGAALVRLGGLDGQITEGGRSLGESDRICLSALRAAIQRPRVLIIGLAGRPIPAEVRAYVEATDATVIATGTLMAAPEKR